MHSFSSICIQDNNMMSDFAVMLELKKHGNITKPTFL